MSVAKTIRVGIMPLERVRDYTFARARLPVTAPFGWRHCLAPLWSSG